MRSLHIWRIKIRRLGNPEPQAAQSQIDRGREPVSGEAIEAVIGREKVRAVIEDAIHTDFSGDTFTHFFVATEVE
jgi:hypothetical protein